MRYKFGKIIVVALGGSIIFPDRIDWKFLRRLRKFFLPRLRGKRFIVVVGGGRLARFYQEAADRVFRLTDEDKDWLGIHATRSNAHLLRAVFRDVADPVVIDGRGRVKKPMHPITIASGWRPGWSTDFVATQLAADFGACEVVVAGKPDFVYTKDHARYKTAVPIASLDWTRYRKMIPAKWVPGAHAPVDPIAARFAARAKIKAIIINGKDLKNFDKLLSGENFRGTIIG